jgi:hypothetical protein
MNATNVLLGLQMRSAINALRHDVGVRTLLALGIVIGLILSVVSVVWLNGQIPVWQVQGVETLHTRIWSLVLGSWLGLGALGALTTLQSLSDERAQLVSMAPIRVDAQWRAVVLKLLLDQSGLFVLVTLVFGATIGREHLLWPALAAIGMAIMLCCGSVIELLYVRYVTPRHWLLRWVLKLAAGGLALACVALLSGFVPFAVPFWVEPAPVIVALTLLVVLILGPCATPLGKLYMAAFHTLQAQNKSGGARTATLEHPFVHLLRRRRNAGSALLLKDLLNQIRDPIGRFAFVFVLYLLPFPWVVDRVSAYEIGEAQLMVAYVALLVLLVAIDQLPSPMGSEGNRLALFLTAPLDLAGLIRAKLFVTLTTLLGIGLLSSVILCLWRGPTVETALFVCVGVTLLVIGIGVIITCGSAWDINLNLSVEGATQALMHERLPATPRRLMVIGCAVLFVVAALSTIVWLPPFTALALIAFVNGVLVVGGDRFAQAQVRRAIRG